MSVPTGGQVDGCNLRVKASFFGRMGGLGVRARSGFAAVGLFGLMFGVAGCENLEDELTADGGAMTVPITSACDETSGCQGDESCEGGACVQDLFDGDLQVLRLGSGRVTDAGNTVLSIDVPEGTESFAVMLEGAGANLIVASQIRSPSGRVIFDFQADVTTNRTDATDVYYTALVPNNPTVAMEAGQWTLTLFSNGSVDITARAVLKTTPGRTGDLDLNLFFVGTDGLDADTAQADEAFQALLTNVARIYAGADVNINVAQYIDITGDDADRLGVIDSIDGPNAELFELFTLSREQSNRALNLFFVADIGGGDAGFALVGLSGGIPGPPGVHGTPHSGVAVNLSSFLEARESGDAEQLERARRLTEIIIAHESGHYLGLYHTTERNGVGLGSGENLIQGVDSLGDTPVCPDSSDTDDDGVLQGSECMNAGGENLLFWSPSRDSRTLTPEQKSVLIKNPLIQ